MLEAIRLYDDDPYLKKTKARVVNINGNQVELDKTIFYPESGGQIGDTGTIGGVRVLDTHVRNDRILHETESSLQLFLDRNVEIVLDWGRRYRIMKLHSASHLMEYFLFQKLGHLDRLGSFVDEKKDRSDYAYKGRLIPEDLIAVGEKINAFIREGHDITIESDPDQPGKRIWKSGCIEMPCGGTHVLNTSEIGSIKLKRKNPGKGKERVETSLSS